MRNKVSTLDIKLDFKYPVGGMECIHYTTFGRDLNPSLFDAIIKCVEDDFNRIENEIIKERDLAWMSGDIIK